jgi:hypothetical protein
VLAATGHHLPLADTVVLTVFPGALYNLVVLVPVFLIQRAFDRRFPVSVLPAW